MKTYLPIILSAALLTGCENEPPLQEPQAVIEGTFSSGGYPTILFSSSVIPGIDGTLQDAMINWGKVTLSDGEREVVLSGRVDNSYLPPFRYYTLDMKGEPGKTYTVTADFKDLHAESTMRMPYPTEIDSLVFSATDDPGLLALSLHFTSPADTPAYYYITIQGTEKESHPSPCMMGTLAAIEPGQAYSMPVMKPKVKIDTLTYIPHFSIGEECIVHLNRVEKPVYDFWKAYDNMILFSTSPFISANESLPTNVEGGFGVWSPQGTASRRFKTGLPAAISPSKVM